MKDLFIKFHNLKKIRILKEKEKINLKIELEHLTYLENLAIESNDFDEAQAIENKIIELKDRLHKIDEDKDSYNNELLELRNEELKILKNKENLLEETSNKLLKLKSKQQKEIDNFTNNELSKHKNDNIKIKKLVEKLQFLKTDLEEKKSFIDEEEEKINNVIKSQSVEIFEELDKLKENRSGIQKVIDQLEKILAKKYSELDSVCKQIENKEGEIDEIKSTYSHEFNKINSKKKNYEEKFKDYNDQNITLEEMKAAFEENQIKLNNRSSNMNNFITEVEKEINEMKNIMGNIDQELTKRENLLKIENSIDAKIRLIEINLKKLYDKKEYSENEINNLEGAVKKLETELVSIDIKLPSLEEEKKTYVIAKNFKEAGRISNELKTLNETKIKNLQTIETKKEKMIELKQEIYILESEFANIEKEKNEFFIEKNITRYEYLICYSKLLKEFIDDYVSKSEYAKVNRDSKSLYSENLSNLNEEVILLNRDIKF
jgi:chromosome segregation ATPase